MNAPTCARCGAVSVLDPCRSCANTAELELVGFPRLELELAGEDLWREHKGVG